MIVELLEEKDGFTNTEIQIADYLLKNPFSITNITASDLGAKTYTSKASIFRFCKKLGMPSYDEFKRVFVLEMHEKERLNSLIKEEPFHKDSSIKDIATILPSFYDTAIHNTKLTLNYSKIEEIVQKIREAAKVDIYGSGITYTCGNTAMFKFLSIGKSCAVHTTINEHYVMSIKDKKNVSILLSFTGGNAGIVKTAKALKALGIYTVGIGGKESSSLENICDAYIEVYQKNLVMSLEMLTPFISITYIFDVLFASLMTKDFDKHLKDAINVMQFKNEIE